MAKAARARVLGRSLARPIRMVISRASVMRRAPQADMHRDRPRRHRPRLGEARKADTFWMLKRSSRYSDVFQQGPDQEEGDEGDDPDVKGRRWPGCGECPSGRTDRGDDGASRSSRRGSGPGSGSPRGRAPVSGCGRGCEFGSAPGIASGRSLSLADEDDLPGVVQEALTGSPAAAGNARIVERPRGLQSCAEASGGPASGRNLHT